jgi:DNA helicase HerA-like ATPase
MEKFSLPRDDEHTTVVGRNGTGKTLLGAFLLAKRNLSATTQLIVDYKGEEIFAALDRAREIGFRDVPAEPGVYILRSRPDLTTQTEDWLWRVWDREHIGLMVDEAYMLPNPPQGGAFQGILTQGRSKRIPVITLTQRPVRVSPFAFSEASHVAVFDLNAKRDRQTVEDRTGEGFMSWLPSQFPKGLPKFHSRWYAVKTDGRYVIKPVPAPKKIVELIDSQLKPKRRWL